MKRWLQNLGEKAQAWMYGRYGYDELSRFCSVVALVLVLISCAIPLFYPVSIALFAWVMFRAHSRNIEKRQKERNVYLKFVGKIKQAINRRKMMWKERKTHRYYRCPNCKIYLRVPKGRGKIEISCPKCQNKIIRNT